MTTIQFTEFIKNHNDVADNLVISKNLFVNIQCICRFIYIYIYIYIHKMSHI